MFPKSWRTYLVSCLPIISMTLEQFQQSMRGIYTTCVQQSTLDESPMAYKNMDEIVEQIAPTADVVQRIRPVYNFKAAECGIMNVL